MFNKRSEVDDVRTEPAVAPVAPASPSLSNPGPGKAKAIIGSTIKITGDMSGEEDLLVEGIVEGTMDLSKNLVTVGKEGRVNATITARMVEVQGTVEGDINGHEQIILRRSGQVRGNISAPRVTLEDGCRFKGSIDMDIESKVADLKPAAGGDDKAKPASGSKQP